MNVYELVTAKIVERLESGVIPWRKQWVTGAPKSLTTGKEYRGINTLVLGLAEYSSRYWATYKQVQKMGGQVRKGEKATPVIYWHWRTPEELARLQAEGKTTDPAPCYPFLAFVFNLDQVDGIERPADDVPARSNTAIEEAERIVRTMPFRPAIKHGASFNPAYLPGLDEVQMPTMGQFESREAYYSVLFHELVHASGSASRLGRFEKAEDANTRARNYSFEELVAELGAAFLCASCGLDNSQKLDDSSAYIAGWLAALKNEKKLILQAASAAQRAADFILGKAEEHAEEVRAAA